MKKEHAPIFAVESANHSRYEEVELARQRLEKEELSHPIEPQTKNELMRQYPDGFIESGKFIVERPKERLVFDYMGREIEHTLYKRLNPDKPSEFDIQSRVTATYDSDGYLESVIRMEVGKYGFVKKYAYTGEGESKELSAIIEQPLLRQGLMDPGPAIGEPTIMDFSDISIHNP